MNSTAIKQMVKKATKSASKHAPVILIGVGVASIVSTAVLAVMATPKAVKVLDDGHDEIDKISNDDHIDEKEKTAEIKEIRKEMCKQFAKLYWKAAANAVIGGTAIIFAYRTQKKKTIAISAAYSIAAKELLDWKETAKELKILNKNNEQKIRDVMAKKKVDRVKKKQETDKTSSKVIFTGKGEEYFIDDWSGQVFKSSVTEVQKAVNEWNQQMLTYDQVTLNDLYYILGIPQVPAGDLGFESGHGCVEVIFGSTFVYDKSYITMGFDRQPMLR